MQTRLADFIKQSPHAEDAERILRACVHCGFCNATCPTYQLLGDELDGPRGRIYQIKQYFEGAPVSKTTRTHLDRCLTCRNCESTCPSGVEYAKLLDMGREWVEQEVPRPILEQAQRWALRKTLAFRARAALVFKLARLFRPLLPQSLKAKVAPAQHPIPLSPIKHTLTRKVIMPEGCVQPSLTPNTNRAAKAVLNHLGFDVITLKTDRCCGALDQHLAAPEDAKRHMRHNIDTWIPLLDAGAEAIVSTASGCGVMLKDYADYFKDEPEYAAKAVRVSQMTKDLSELLCENDLSGFANQTVDLIAYHPPCTLQHGQKLKGSVESILMRCGYELAPVKNNHLCCGAAGTYSLFQADIANQLLDRKLENLQQESIHCIVTANVGCQTHLASQANVPVKHWIELLAEPLLET